MADQGTDRTGRLGTYPAHRAHGERTRARRAPFAGAALAGAALLGAVAALLTALPALAAPPDSSAGLEKRVCVDAGHGGPGDPGAVSSNPSLRESDLTLDIAGRLSALLTGHGFGVVMTRTDDRGLGNTERANICNAGGATSVLSIHLNASSDRSVDYFRAFYGKRNKDLEFAHTISDAYALRLPGSTTPLPKLAPTNFASGLLLKTEAPAALAETVFLTNPAEAAALGDGTGTRQQQIAEQLFAGLRAWYGA